MSLKKMSTKSRLLSFIEVLICIGFVLTFFCGLQRRTDGHRVGRKLYLQRLIQVQDQRRKSILYCLIK